MFGDQNNIYLKLMLNTNNKSVFNISLSWDYKSSLLNMENTLRSESHSSVKD